jgi:hypothetical protein
VTLKTETQRGREDPQNDNQKRRKIMATITLAKLISDWELLNTALQPHLTDMPFLKDKATELEGLIAEAKGMDSKQQDLRGTLQETVRQRGELEKRGKVLRSLLASLLRGSLGFENQTLLGFGVKPRRPRKKKAPGDTPAPQPSAQQ